MSCLKRVLNAAALWLLCSVALQAMAADGPCPEGFQPSPSGEACFAKDLAGADGSFGNLLVNPGIQGECPPGRVKPQGVNVCILEGLTVNALGSKLVLEAQTSRFCPEGFHRPAGVNACVANNLLLQRQGNDAVLSGSGDDCPTGFYRPVGSTICVAGNETSRTLDLPGGQPCPPGFHRPPGVAICIAKNMVYATSPINNVIPPIGVCPRNFYRPPGVRFCIPKYIKAPATGSINPVITDIVLACPAGSIESWSDVPIYDPVTGLVKEFVPTRFCIPAGLEPAG